MKEEMLECLTREILPFWMDRMVDDRRGGFYGRMTGEGRLVKDAPKGAILNARILWTFSAAYRVLGNEQYRVMARRALDYIVEHLVDHEHGGVYWSVDAHGRPLDTKKQTYAIAFTIYGLAEYMRATRGRDDSGDVARLATSLFNDIEAHALDKEKGGYIEAFSRTWGEASDMRLSDKDEPERKTMNTHLHLLEAYTCLLRVLPCGQLRQAHRRLIDIFLSHIIDMGTGHLRLFFTDAWQSPYDYISYGHDIEASWLLHEAAVVQGDPALLATILPVVSKIAVAATEGLTPDGALIYESRPGVKVDTELHWWVQAEAVVGWANLHQLESAHPYLSPVTANPLLLSRRVWEYIKRHLIDKESGEWYWSILPDGTANTRDDKAGFWKCPYHNSRACLEMIERNL